MNAYANSPANPTPVDQEVLDRAMSYLRALLNGHAGGMEITEIDDAGVVDVAFTRACEACPNLPMTFVSTVRNTLLEVPGVTDVRSSDVHASAPALNRIARALGARPVTPVNLPE
ncbi:NifU family protein [Kitasatospora sp. NPDC001603]|uniref:NifU family protein n=1 Tax=Kitasatospora sp. NPDC001603 TaxID=3154388 RepID=UPI0033348C51